MRPQCRISVHLLEYACMDQVNILVPFPIHQGADVARSVLWKKFSDARAISCRSRVFSEFLMPRAGWAFNLAATCHVTPAIRFPIPFSPAWHPIKPVLLSGPPLRHPPPDPPLHAIWNSIAAPPLLLPCPSPYHTTTKHWPGKPAVPCLRSMLIFSHSSQYMAPADTRMSQLPTFHIEGVGADSYGHSDNFYSSCAHGEDSKVDFLAPDCKSIPGVARRYHLTRLHRCTVLNEFP